MDAANLLKPLLARGELRTIGATTLTEYRKYIEKDSAFERRFQQVWSALKKSARDIPCSWRGLTLCFVWEHTLHTLVGLAFFSDPAAWSDALLFPSSCSHHCPLHPAPSVP